MPHIEARPQYRVVGAFALAALALTIGAVAVDAHLYRYLFVHRSIGWHILLMALFVFSATAALRLILNLCFRDVALQIDDHGVYVEGVTRHPVRWSAITAVSEQRRFIVFRTTDEEALIHFALFRASFGRLGWRNFRDVIISCTLLDVADEDVLSAIRSGMARFGNA